MIVNQVQRTVQPPWGVDYNSNGLGLITPEINRLDLNGGCVGCARGLGADPAAVQVLLAVRKKLTGTGYLYLGEAERLAVNNALFELDSPSYFATTSPTPAGNAVGNPTPIPELRAQIDTALRKAGVTPPSDRPKWLIPAAIGVGVFALGVVILSAARRK